MMDWQRYILAKKKKNKLLEEHKAETSISSVSKLVRMYGTVA